MVIKMHSHRLGRFRTAIGTLNKTVSRPANQRDRWDCLVKDNRNSHRLTAGPAARAIGDSNNRDRRLHPTELPLAR